MRANVTLFVCVLSAACSTDETPSGTKIPRPGSWVEPSGAGSFTLGVATAATQIEEATAASDWYVWGAPTPGGLGQGTAFVGDAVQGYSRALEDNALIAGMHLDAYRFSPSWSRIEPTRDEIDQAALDHYDAVITDLRDKHVEPVITVHHFSSPRWVDDLLRATGEPCVPSDTDLCGWNDAVGGELVVAELAEHAALLARTYGDRVDHWVSLNEPINYILASYGTATFPPGRGNAVDLLLPESAAAFFRVVERYASAHVAIYDAIKANDLIDADGDGVAAHVGYAASAAVWVPARDGAVSDAPNDVLAAETMRYMFQEVFTQAFTDGYFDLDLDHEPDSDELHADWTGKLDFLGVQHYFRAGVTDAGALNLPLTGGLPCVAGIPITAACIEALDVTKCVPTMHYEFYEPGIREILTQMSARWPELPLVVTESGIAAEQGDRRAQHVVRSLEQILIARDEGVDVRGYFHWSLMDNFEWAEGFGPRFGLHRVDASDGDFDRVPTRGAEVFTEIAKGRNLTDALRQMWGGTGPFVDDAPGSPAVNATCQAQ